MLNKLWVDDLRVPPDETWEWASSSAHALMLLKDYGFDVVSLDHDLGGDDTTRPIVLWWCETGNWPGRVLIHTANPVGYDWIHGMVERYKP